MSGIAGIIDLTSDREIDRRALDRMLATMQLSRSGTTGVYLEPGYAFGQSSSDTKQPSRPNRSASGMTTMLFDGTLDQPERIGRELSLIGRRVMYEDSAGIVTELIDARGFDGLDALKGPFILAAISQRTEMVLLARDRFGEKPLFYHRTDDGYLFFASDLDALLASDFAPSLFDEDAIADYMRDGVIAAPRTVYSNIFAVPAGQAISFRRHHQMPALRSWWSLAWGENIALDHDAAVAGTEGLLIQTLEQQTRKKSSCCVIENDLCAAALQAVSGNTLYVEPSSIKTGWAQRLSLRGALMPLPWDGDISNGKTETFGQPGDKALLSSLGGEYLFWAEFQFREKTALHLVGRSEPDQYLKLSSEMRERLVYPSSSAPSGLSVQAQKQQFLLDVQLPAELFFMDQMSRVTGKNVRHPYLDAQLAQWAIGIPSQLHQKRGQGGQILHAILAKNGQSHQPDPVQQPTDLDWQFLVDHLMNSHFWKDCGYFDIDRSLGWLTAPRKWRGQKARALIRLYLFDRFLGRDMREKSHILSGEMQSMASSGSRAVA